MRKLTLLVFLAAAVFSCKSPEARRPVMQKTGSYIDQSIERNKQLVAQEEEVINQIADECNNSIECMNSLTNATIQLNAGICI